MQPADNRTAPLTTILMTERPMAPRKLPDQAYLRECFDYGPETGELRWRKRPLAHFPDARACNIWNTKNASRIVGWTNPRGYRATAINGTKYLCHRIILKLVLGKDLSEEVDHINHDGSDNRWANLRPATSTENSRNQRPRRGLKGVTFLRRRNVFVSQITIDKRNRFLGHYRTAEAAHEAYCKAAIAHFGAFYNPK